MSEKAFTLRIDEKLFDKIKASAEKNKRSIAKEIEWVLEQMIDRPDNQKILDYIVQYMKDNNKNCLTLNSDPAGCDIIKDIQI